MGTLASTALELARWQFALTTLFHFVFVPLTLGLAPLLALLQTHWHRTGDERWLRLTRFFGTLFLINFAIGVATGLVMEFQFGMNWSVFSAYVGDVFGPPLAIEGLGAFMLEATFIGLWIFGWNRLSPRIHLATIYLVWARHLALGVLHPRRQLLDAAPGRLRDQLADRARRGDRHRRRPLPARSCSSPGCTSILAGLITGALPSCSASRAGTCCAAGTSTSSAARAKLAIVVLLPVSFVQLGVGSEFGRHGHRRPADEDRRDGGAVGDRAARLVLALPDRRLHRGRPDAVASTSRSRGCSRSSRPTRSRARWSGINELQAQYEQQYGPGNYVPDVRLVYWSMRVMAYLGTLLFLLAALGRVALLAQAARARDVVPAGRARRDRASRSSRTSPAGSSRRRAASRGSCYGLLKTEDAVSGTSAPGPSASAWASS